MGLLLDLSSNLFLKGEIGQISENSKFSKPRFFTWAKTRENSLRESLIFKETP
jgi:hypothetical protein